MRLNSLTMSRTTSDLLVAILALSSLTLILGVKDLLAKEQASKVAESIVKYEVNASGLAITVRTNGCTSKSDFALLFSNGEVTLTREVPDTCKGFFPAGKELFWNWGEIGGNEMEFQGVTNPIVDR